MSSPLKFLPLRPKQIVHNEYYRRGQIRTIIQSHSHLQSLTRFYGWACRCSPTDIEQTVSTIDHAPESGGHAITDPLRGLPKITRPVTPPLDHDPMLGTDRELIGH